MDNFDDITIEMFPDGYRDIAELVGIDTACKICELAGGGQVYIPMLDNVRWPLICRAIVKDYLAGVPYDRLSKKYNRSVDTIRRIVKNGYFMQTKSVIDYIDELDGGSNDDE